jgi:sensor histidine kinase YesM
LNKLKSWVAYVLVLFLGVCGKLPAQNPYIKHFTTSSGLPTNTIYQIIQDSRKMIWFTSDAGVIRYDGNEFRSFRKKDGLSSNDVVRIREDQMGRIWIFNYNSAVDYIYNDKVYNSREKGFLNELKGKGFILDFFTDKHGTIHFYNFDGDVFSLDTLNRVSQDFLLKNLILTGKGGVKVKIEQMRISYLSKNNQEEWIILSNAGIFKQNISNRMVTAIDTSIHCRAAYPYGDSIIYIKTYTEGLKRLVDGLRKENIKFTGDPNKIKTVIQDSDGFIWIADYDEGVFCIKDGQIIKHFDFREALGLLQDHEKNIWISTETDGIYMINHDLLEQTHFDRSYFNNLGLNNLAYSLQSGLWCTTSKSAYMLRKDKFYRLPVSSDIQPLNMIFFFNDETLLLGSIGQLFYTYRGLFPDQVSSSIKPQEKVFHDYSLKNILKDNIGELVVMFDQKNILITKQLNPCFDPLYNKVSERVMNAYFNLSNNLVINSRKNYLFKNKKLEDYPELARFNGKIISDHMVIAGKAELFNIDGDSVFLLLNHRFFNLSSAFDTPIENQIRKIIYDDTTLYLSTLNDIYVCHSPMKAITGGTLHLEPLSINFNNINDILLHDDTLFIASDDGLTIISEASISGRLATPPIPYLQSITVNDNLYSLSDQEIVLTGKNKIYLSFGCISYSSKSIIYSYMLEGSESTWTVGTGSGINIVYQGLPRGSYILKLRVRKSNSEWSKPLEIAVTIKPTLTEYPAFWVMIFIVVSVCVFLLILWRKSQNMRKTENAHKLIIMEQKALQAMMNPHFIFNSLSSVQNYLLKNKVSEAMEFLAQFSSLIRQTLNSTNLPLINLSEEVERLKSYLNLEQKRLIEKFVYTINIDKVLLEDEVIIPGMLIQPLVENAIWHGIAKIEEKGEISIIIRVLESKAIKIIVEDNGPGIEQKMQNADQTSTGNHIGVKVIRRRLYLLEGKYNIRTGLHYSASNPDNINPGTRVELIIPFFYNESEAK